MSSVVSKINGNMEVKEEDVICLSSDDEAELKQEGSSFKRRLSASLLSIMPNSSNSNGGLVGSSKTNGLGYVAAASAALKNSRRGGPQEVTIDDDDFEFETAGDINGFNYKEREVHEVSDSEDDDVQVLESVGVEGSSVKKEGENRSGGRKEPVPGPSSSVSSETAGESQEECVSHSQKALNEVVKQLRKNRHVTGKQFDKVGRKFQEAFDKIKHLSPPVHVRLQEELYQAVETLRIDSDKPWGITKHLLDLMSPEVIVNLSQLSPEEREKKRQEEKRVLVEKFEKQLLKYHEKIRDLEEMSVDWDAEDDWNSAYLMEQKMKNRLIAAYYKLCDITKCNYFTDRPTQKKVSLRKSNAASGYPEIDEEVEGFVNGKGCLFIPDFYEIHEIVKRVNQNKRLGMNSENSFSLAQQIFRAVASIIKGRRAKEFNIVMHDLLYTDTPLDPADEDTELRQKLLENETLRKSEKEVLDHFAKVAAEQGGQPVELAEPEDINVSPPPSDNEEEDEDEETEELTSDGEESEKIDREKVTAGQRQVLTEETDDEEEEGQVEYFGNGSPSVPQETASEQEEESSSKVDAESEVVTDHEVQEAQVPNETEQLVPEDQGDEPPPKRKRLENGESEAEDTTENNNVCSKT